MGRPLVATHPTSSFRIRNEVHTADGLCPTVIEIHVPGMQSRRDGDSGLPTPLGRNAPKAPRQHLVPRAIFIAVRSMIWWRQFYRGRPR